MSFLSFSTTATLAQAIKTMAQTRERMAAFQIPTSTTDTPTTTDHANVDQPHTQQTTNEPTPIVSSSTNITSTVSVSAISTTTSIARKRKYVETLDDQSGGDDSAATMESISTTSMDPHLKSTDESSNHPSDTIDLTQNNEDEKKSESSAVSSDDEMDLVEPTTTASSHHPSPPPLDQLTTSSTTDTSSTSAIAATRCLHYISRGPIYAQSHAQTQPLPSFDELATSHSLARTYPFTLDDFQQRSIEVLENHQHLLVAAHTSAGKTVVAEYAIAMVFRENERRRREAELKSAGTGGLGSGGGVVTPKRVIYTAPIKALSNQKYREFKEIFTGPYEDVGLMTGDVILNPSATCLIMTTEILRSMLYNGSELLSDTSVVIFDEIHYMKDLERGIIWEESIIMLAPQIQCVFLSATLSNSEEFAEWIHEIKAEQIRESMKRDQEDEMADDSSSIEATSSSIYERAVCNVVYTNTRPIPLTHYLFLKGGQGLYQIKNDRQQVLKDGSTAIETINIANFKKIQAEIVTLDKQRQSSKAVFGDLIKQQHALTQEKSTNNAAFAQRIQEQLTIERATKRAEVPDLVKLITLSVEQDWLPLIVFSFSRRECEHLSLTASDRKWKLDLTSAEEKEMIQLIFDRAMDSLTVADRQLPQLGYILPLLLRGFAVHHSGLLPILKEIIEILCQETLIKCLFATETFAMGINIPVRTCIFTTLEKFDGSKIRYLQSSEYTQMAGRAGRRGVDTKGIVIMMVKPEDLESVAPTLNSNDDSTLGGHVREILAGSSDPLQSKFRLTYNMILNLIRCSSSFDPTYILRKSFLHFQQKYPWKFRKSDASSAVSNGYGHRRQRRGEIGVSSTNLGAGGKNFIANKQAAETTMQDEMRELQEEMNELDEGVNKLGLTQAQQAAIQQFELDFRQFKQFQHQQYEFSLADPLHRLLPFLQSGRLVYLQSPGSSATNTTATSQSRAAREPTNWGWGLVIHWRKRHAKPGDEGQTEYVVDVLVPVGLSQATNETTPTTITDASSSSVTLTEHVKRWGEILIPQPPQLEQLNRQPQGWEHGEWQQYLRPNRQKEEDKKITSETPQLYHIINCSLSMIHSISIVRLYLPPSLLLTPATETPHEPPPQALRHALFQVMEQVVQNFPQRHLPKIEIKDWNIEEQQTSKNQDSAALKTLQANLSSLERRLQQSLIHSIPLNTIHQFFELQRQRQLISTQQSSYTSTLTTTHLTSYRIELQTRLRILRRFKHLTSDSLITSKGRIAAEIECGSDELLITEFIYEGSWKKLDIPELIAILTVFLELERSSADRLAIPTDALKEAYGHIKTLAREISDVSNECGLVLDPSKYLASFKHDFIPIAYVWMSDPTKSFHDLVGMSNLFEGTVIRIFRRLDELLTQLMKAAANIGEADLMARLEEGQKRMKKGIIFTGSLYI